MELKFNGELFWNVEEEETVWIDLGEGIYTESSTLTQEMIDRHMQSLREPVEIRHTPHHRALGIDLVASTAVPEGEMLFWSWNEVQASLVRAMNVNTEQTE